MYGSEHRKKCNDRAINFHLELLNNLLQIIRISKTGCKSISLTKQAFKFLFEIAVAFAASIF